MKEMSTIAGLTAFRIWTAALGTTATFDGGGFGGGGVTTVRMLTLKRWTRSSSVWMRMARLARCRAA